MSKNAYVYFMANHNNNVLYIGVTNNLARRIYNHKNQIESDCFTAKYNCSKLVYSEHSNDIKSAIQREKQLKNWKREWKNALVKEHNPEWKDLSVEYGITEEIKEDCGSSPQ